MQKFIAFIDTEIDPLTNKILDIGGIKSDADIFHAKSIPDFTSFLKGSQFVCGHNIFNHDLRYIEKELNAIGISQNNVIDTLFLSPLLFPTRPYHALLKDDKLQTEEINNPLNDAIKAKDLFYDEVTAFFKLEEPLKRIYYYLLNNHKEFHVIFDYMEYRINGINIEREIRDKFHYNICEHADIKSMIYKHPVELAYCLALIQTRSRYSITPPWVLKNYPAVEGVMYLLRNKPCITGCDYCNEALDVHKGLKRFFGYDSYRQYAGEPLATIK